MLNILTEYKKQLTTFLSVTNNTSLEEANKEAETILKTYFKDRSIKYFNRDYYSGDREVQEGTLFNYIHQNLSNNNVLVPTFTSYLNTNVRKSILSEFISVNVKTRSIAKKEAQKAKIEGNLELFLAKNNEQNVKKLANNSLSGVFSQEACILHNPTAHSTLTSITRTITSLSNASNELLISGNKYLPRPIDVLNNIVYITTYVNSSNIKKVVDKYNLYLPTVEDTVKVLKYSSDLYFTDNNFYNKYIIPYLSKLDRYVLAGICYTGNLYHIRVFNDSFIRSLINEFILVIDNNKVLDDISTIYKIDEAILYLVHYIFFNRIKGYGKDYNKLNGIGILNSILETCNNIKNKLAKYEDFFNTFLITEIFPPNSFRQKNMRRRTVVLSDTDSTCFTLDEWVTWYKGNFYLDDNSLALTGLISYIASQSIINILAILSKNMNISEDLIHTLSMKNEYLWLVHAPAEVSKHYFAYTAMQEGNVFKEPEIEIKGVHLKNSAVPKNIIEDSKELMKYILSTIANNNKISLNSIIYRIINLENEIISSVTNGESKYLKKSKIKDKGAYSQDETKSPYQRHLFWVDVFSEKYGNIQDPPYDIIKIPTIVTNNVSLNEWLESIEDIELRNRLLNWLKVYNKKCLPTIYLNEIYVISNGIPNEIARIIDIKRIVMDITIQHRIILETLGVILHEDKLVSEQFTNVIKKIYD